MQADHDMPAKTMQRAFLGLGGNLGDPTAAMALALQALDAQNNVKVVAVSSLYRTPPWGVSDQPDFINAAASVDTTLEAQALLDLCLDIEKSLLRVRNERWGPRLIDIDILLFGNETIDRVRLHVPHPRMTERAFVMVPLAEIAPQIMIDSKTAQQHLDNLDASAIKRLPQDRNWWQDKPEGKPLSSQSVL